MSYPIATFHKYDYSYEELQNIPFNITDFANYVHDGEKIIFCKTDFLHEAFQFIRTLNNEVILITGNSDYPIDEAKISNMPDQVKIWFAENANVKHPKLKGLPIGIENYNWFKDNRHGQGWMHAMIKKDAIQKYWQSSRQVKKEHLIYSNMSVWHDQPSRINAKAICDKLDYCYVKEHSGPGPRSIINYMNELSKSKSIVCPRGNGIDTYRIWEAFCLKAIPIVLRDELAIQQFEDEYPILFVENWLELKDKETIEKRIEEKRSQIDFSKLTVAYWIDKIEEDKKWLDK